MHHLLLGRRNLLQWELLHAQQFRVQRQSLRISVEQLRRHHHVRDEQWQLPIRIRTDV
jgi:hypothetical protein